MTRKEHPAAPAYLPPEEREAKTLADNSRPKSSQDHGPTAGCLSFRRWSLSFAFRIIRTRTPFAAFLSSILHLHQDGSMPPAKSLFPLPLPYKGVFRQPDPRMNSRARGRLGIQRVVFVTVAALDYLHAGCSFVPRAALRRPPNAAQTNALRYIERLVRACGAIPPVNVPAASRRSAQLIARLGEVSSFLTKMGPSFDPYGPAFPGVTQTSEEKEAALSPYRSLQVERLKLSGQGNWDPSPYLDPSLYLAFREPNSLVLEEVAPPGRADVPLLNQEKVPELEKVALLWDARRLLVLHDAGPPLSRPYEGVRLFNALKNETTDRQIADRRGRNWVEGSIPGPSRHIPTGVALTGLYVSPSTHRLSINISDRRDFYHQLRVPLRRSRRNILVPPLPTSRLRETWAYQEFLQRSGPQVREPAEANHASRPDHLYLGFGAVLQGDSLGVEYATSSHSNFLSSHGLLGDDTRVLGSSLFPPGGRDGLIEGLVIDDYYSIAQKPHGSVEPCSAELAAAKAKEAYADSGILGSPEKDINDAPVASCTGAEVDTSPSTIALGLGLVGPSRAKRVSLAAVTLEVARLEATSDHLHLCLLGAWTSGLLYRRPLMSVLDRCYKLIDASQVEPDQVKVVPLPRTTADELVLLAALTHILTADISAPWLSCLFATDSSDDKGAIVQTSLPEHVSRLLWHSTQGTASSARLLSRERVALRRVDEMFEELPGDGVFEPPKAGPAKPLALRFHFIEVCGGTGKVSQYIREFGWRTGPLLDITISPEYDFTCVRVLEWVLHLITEGLVDAVFVRPPSATFSDAVRPALRSWAQPFGFDPSERRTKLGTVLALRSLTVLKACHDHGIASALEQPRNSKMIRLPSWKAVAALPGASEIFTVGCAFGTACMKPWRFLAVACDLSSLTRCCSKDHTHVRSQGHQTTKASAAYPDALALAIAKAFSRAISLRHAALESCSLEVEGLESPLVNQLAQAGNWKVVSVWTWRRPVHINLLETACVYRLCCKLARQGLVAARFCSLCDSNVARCAIAKGRSPSAGLKKGLRRIGAVCLAFGLYPAAPYCPTRLMPADHPTRDKPLPPALPGFSLSQFSSQELRCLAALPKLRRWAAGWVRLLLLLSDFRPAGRPEDRFRCRSFRTFVPSPLAFDATLGYPGEGPCWFYWLVLLWVGFSGVQGPSALSPSVLSHGPPPRNAGDLERMRRRAGDPLPLGRPVEAKTKARRDQLWSSFLMWLKENDIPSALFEDTAGYVDVDGINAVLVRYGRQLYTNGRPFSHYSELLNSFTARVPKLRRLVQPAWDIAFSWKRAEPIEHHVAMPWQVLISLLTLALSWGWTQVAAVLALAWGGLLRIGEVLAAQRKHLLLPIDFGHTLEYALLSIGEPKTRYKAARHQAARLDQPDLLQVVALGFEKLTAEDRLWPFSGQTLRNRFRQLCNVLGLPCSHSSGLPWLELASLRAGGATWLMMQCEDSELVRRRGRWLTSRVTEIYVQEVSAIQFLPRLPSRTRDAVFFALASFRAILDEVSSLARLGIQPKHWHLFLATGKRA